MALNTAFNRYAYSPVSPITAPAGVNTSSMPTAGGNNLAVFTGGDLQAFVNNIQLGNLESITWSISVETVGNYVMGRRDALVYTTGKRVIVGSMVLAQYDRHALIEQVFQLSNQNIYTLNNLWQSDDGLGAGAQLYNQAPVQFTAAAGIAGAGYGGLFGIAANLSYAQSTIAGSTQTGSLTQGMSATAYNANLQAMAQTTAQQIGNTKIQYSDQLPPFDVTLVGVTKLGQAATCAIFGIQITQETTGMSMNDLGNQVALSFTALGVSHWVPITANGTGALRTLGAS